MRSSKLAERAQFAEQRISLIYDLACSAAWHWLGQGDAEAAIALIREGVSPIATALDVGRHQALPYGLALLAERYGSVKRRSDGGVGGDYARRLEIASCAMTSICGMQNCDRVDRRAALARRGASAATRSKPRFSSDLHRKSPPRERQITGIARCNEPRPPMGPTGLARRSPRPPGTGVRLVHRGLRQPPI